VENQAISSEVCVKVRINLLSQRFVKTILKILHYTKKHLKIHIFILST